MKLYMWTNHLPKLVHIAVTFPLRTCRAMRGLADVRHGETFPRNLHSILTNQGTVNCTR